MPRFVTQPVVQRAPVLKPTLPLPASFEIFSPAPNTIVINAAEHPIWVQAQRDCSERKSAQVGPEGAQASPEGGDEVGGDET